jgi:hypothetical protein
MMQFHVKPMGFGPQIITQSPLTSGEVSFAYAAAINIIHGSPPYTTVVVSGSLPAGLGIANNIISGIPTTAIAATFGLQATDSKGAKSAVTSFGLTIVSAVTITTASLPNGTVGQAYSTTLAASGGATPYTWAIVAGSIDPGLSLNTATGAITGTPITATSYSPTFQVQDALGYEATATLGLTINAQPQAATPTFSPIAGTYTSTQSVTISCTTPSSTIYYTTDGSTPTTSSTVYTSPISVSVSETVKAIATATGYTQSAVGSAAYVINTPAAASATAYKFNPSYFYATYHITPGDGLPATGAGNYLDLDITQLSNYPLPSNQIPAYAFAMKWADLETFPGPSTNQNSASQYSITALAAVINQIQAKFPSTGCRMAIYLSYEGAGANSDSTIRSRNWSTSGGQVPSWVALANGTPSTFSVPTTFGQGSPVTTGVAAPIYSGASYYNIIFANWDGSTNYGVTMPDWRSLQVQQAIIQMLQWLSQATFTITTGPFAGTWTLNTCPCVELIGNNDEMSWTFDNGPDQPQTPSGALSPTWQNLMSGYVNVMNATAALFPNTIVGTCTTFGITGQSGSSNAGYDMGALVNPNIAFSSSGVPRYSPVVALSGSDTYASDYGAAHSEASPAALGHTGRVSPANYVQSQPLISPTVTSMVGQYPYVGQIQPSDWDTNAKVIPAGVTIHTTSMVQALMQSAQIPGATHLVISNGDGTTFDREAWAGFGSSSYIEAGLLASYVANPLTTTLPTALMYGPSITSVTAVTTTSQTLGWAAITGQGTGLSLLLFRNGTQIASVNPASVTSFNDTGLTVGTAYTYTLKMSNSNGTGPAGPSMVAYTDLFQYASNFSDSTLARQGAATYSGGNLVFFTSPTHQDASTYFHQQQPPTAFSTQFTWKSSGLAGAPTASGFNFILQNTVSPPGQPGATGTGYSGDANMCGYGAATNQWAPNDSIGIKFDANCAALQSYPSGGTPSSTGLYVNGGPQVQPTHTLGLMPYNDLNPNGINFYQGHTYNVGIVYDGSLITMTLLDTTSNAQARLAWPLNLANTTNGNGNWVGFTGGESSGNGGTYTFTNWIYTQGYNTRLATPTFSPATGQYSGTQTVTISVPAGSTCYYTTNGLLPTTSSTLYTGPLTVSSNEVIQAVAIQAGYTDSLVGSGVYKIGTSNTINFTSFSAGNLIPVGYTYLSGSTYRLSDTTSNTGGALWFPVPVTISTFSTTFTLNLGANGQACGFVIQNNPAPYVGLTGVQITGTGGQISFNAATNIVVGQFVTVSGSLPTYPAAGSIQGYSNTTTYSVSATNGSTTATLISANGYNGGGTFVPGNPITTVAGTPGGTWSQNIDAWSGGPTAVGVGDFGAGYGGMDGYNGSGNQQALGLLNSVLLYIDSSKNPNSIGLYTGGNQPLGSGISTGLNFKGGGTFTFVLTYDGTNLSVNINSGAFTHSWAINIPATVAATSGGSASTAYVGFCGGSGGSAAIAALTTWTGF